MEFYEVEINITKATPTPHTLESLILNKYRIDQGDFLFIEWETLTDEILVTSQRTAFFKKYTCKATLHITIQQRYIICNGFFLICFNFLN